MGNELSIDVLRKLCIEKSIVWTTHILERLQERGIHPSDVKHCIMDGEIIEQYPDDYPHASCLILGANVNNKYIHAVISADNEKIWAITAYYPTSDKWENDYKTRKVVN